MSWRIKVYGKSVDVLNTLAQNTEMPKTLRLAIIDLLTESNSPDGASVDGYGLCDNAGGIGSIDKLEVQKYWLASKPIPDQQPQTSP
jgi:hypothetical protein